MDERNVPDDSGQRAPQDPPGAGGDPPEDGEPVVVLGVDAAQHAQELLAEHVPLTLLADLLSPTGETSAELLDEEGLPEEEWWRPPVDPEAPGA
ncbi:hypothetical protein [Cellulomonas phragmiteti]|uniref:Uncharacterized protein n=1 Tax=Cellulomonas phragmiteti TaxID=478780 RepID=A0ABQ4DG39_9CELL|nr:hypothetical protein [Cellulomonas phragmiteti]GIG38307.1 hypothetical protein Cph01nite_00690 [Cellulomonas phragmiteti]